MFGQCLTVGIIILFSAMLPGPDFALVTKNTLFHSRRSGLFTSIGIVSAILVHITYCSFGLAMVITHSLWLFHLIKFLGAGYLLYLGWQSFKSRSQKLSVTADPLKDKLFNMSDLTAFRQGFLCNLLNPKATLSFLALFTLVIRPDTSLFWLFVYAAEIIFITITWFVFLTIVLSHPRVTHFLEKAEKYIAKFLGVLLMGFGIALIFIKA